MAKILFSLGLNLVDPPSQLVANEGGQIECSILTNFKCIPKGIQKIGGFQAYNATSLGNKGIPWVERSYHLRGDNSIVTRLFGFYQGDIYYGDDVAGTLTKTNATGFRKEAIPLSESFQVSGNSILYVYTGVDTPMKYDGNGAFEWEKTGLDSDIIGGVTHLQRLWYWKTKSSNLSYSIPLFPETIDDEILVGDNARDSFIKACIKIGNERFFVFKNNSIWELFGRTSTQFYFRRVTGDYGLASKRALFPIGGGIIFQNEYDKELYFFGGTEASIKPLTEDTIRLRDIMDLTQDSIDNATMTTHKGYFRFAFQHREDTAIDANGSELIYPINDFRPDGLPKWSLIRGSNVSCYSRWTKYGDKNELVTGRSDMGKLMYHDRGKDWDGTQIETKVRTGDIIASEDKRVEFKGFNISGKLGSHTLPITFRYYLDGRFPETAGVHGLIPEGETRTIGVVKLQQSSMFNDRIVPYVSYSRGMSIAFEFEDKNLGTDVELYSVAFTAQTRGKKRNQKV
uniref:Uncharacterized protein n=1 Tax=viral metagenome TaxID=1070528 RepID=A0A6M3KQC1_9ZZZZ